jgi:hypothetical protein
LYIAKPLSGRILAHWDLGGFPIGNSVSQNERRKKKYN